MRQIVRLLVALESEENIALEVSKCSFDVANSFNLVRVKLIQK